MQGSQLTNILGVKAAVSVVVILALGLIHFGVNNPLPPPYVHQLSVQWRSPDEILLPER